jgi:Family of unknown function (DUF6104)
MEGTMSEGIEELRDKRGDQDVTFNDVCDHFRDYVDRHPENEAVIDDVARFIANVEDIDHEHEEDPKKGMAPSQDAEH